MILAPNTALIGPHGEVAEYLGEAVYLHSPGARIRRMAGLVVVPQSHIGTEWNPVPGIVETVHHDTGNWNNQFVARLAVR